MLSENAEICRQLRSQLGKSHDLARTLLRIKKARNTIFGMTGKTKEDGKKASGAKGLRGIGGTEDGNLGVEKKRKAIVFCFLTSSP